MSAAGSETADRAPFPLGDDRDTDLAGRLAKLSLDKRALLERRLLERRAGTEDGRRTMPRRTGPGPWSLSHAQELMWLLDQLTPGGNAYNSPAATRLEGPLDVDALRLAINAVVARNEVLRTTYDTVDGRPVQVLHPPEPVELAIVDLEVLGPEARSAELDRVLKEEAERPFDLRLGPILRPTLVRLAAEDSVLLLVVHHIAIDGWSKGVLWRELTSCYEALAAGRAVDLPHLPLQYADWAVWHRCWLENGVLDDQLGYWRAQLADAPALLELPTDHPRPLVRTGSGDRSDTMFAAETLAALHRLAREENATLFMVVLAAFGTLLARYTGQDDIVVGTPIAGRNRVEIEDLIGYFMNTVALRLDLSGDPSFRELLQRVRRTTVGAFAHQDVPFERVVAAVNPTRDLSRTPLFQVMLVLQNQRRNEFAPAGLQATPVRHERGWAKFDLTLGLGERPEGLNSSWEYSTDLFDAPTVERLMRGFGVLLDALAVDPDRRVSELPVVPDEALRQLAEWEDGGPALGAGRCLPDLVADRAAAAPNAPALDDGPAALDYAGLMLAADQLAGRLRALGVGPQTPVGVCADRSALLVVALLGVLRAGGSCVPLDPAYPVDRLRAMLTDADPLVVLTQADYVDRLATAGRVAIVLGDVPLPRNPEPPTGLPPQRVQPDSAAYVLYTSGSTGTPRGVVLEHAGLVNHALAAGRLYRLGTRDRVLQFSSPSFDISIEEIFATLAAGGCVVPRPPDLPLGGVEFLEWLESRQITVLDLPTAYWHEWVGDLTARGLALPSSLRLVVVGGEKASPAVYAAWRELAGDRVAWINTYGPTEASVVATAFAPAPDWLPVEGAELPIGAPIPGVRVRVLDPSGQRVPVGVHGELHVGGVGVARGYLNDREATAQRLRLDPERPDERLYATGDIVRRGPDGSLYYVGRTDAQVKLRGFRIEPAEVEAALAASGMVDESLVLVRGAPGSERLVAYAVTRGSASDHSGRDLRDLLSERLPAHLVPDTVVPLPSLPRTLNDKVDIEALPVPYDGGLPSRAEPRDDIERRLLEIWRSLLDTESIGVRDSFFDLGGHSLLAVRLFARVEQMLGTRLPLATLITAPTIAELAEVVRRERAAPSWRSLVTLQPGGTRAPLFLVHGVRGQLLLYGALVRRLGADQPVYGLQSVGLDRVTAPLTRIPDMAAHYIAEIRSVQPHGPYLLGGFCFGGVIAVEMAAQLDRDGEDVALIALLHARPYGEDGSGRERFGERARRRIGEFLATEAADRYRMIPETVGRICGRRIRASHAGAVRYYLRRGRPVPFLLRDIDLVNRMAVTGYSTPENRAHAVLFLADNGVRDVERKLRMWTGVVPDLEVRRIQAPGPSAAAMLAEPHVADLARQLRDELDAALSGST